MSARIIDGSKVANEMQAEMVDEVKKLKAQGITPGLSVVLVGEEIGRAHV